VYSDYIHLLLLDTVLYQQQSAQGRVIVLLQKLNGRDNPLQYIAHATLLLNFHRVIEHALVCSETTRVRCLDSLDPEVL
jgi:hypothetical protein